MHPPLPTPAGSGPPEFLGPEFPEQAFPPAPERAAAYVATCRRGYTRMARQRVAITGLARDVAGTLPLTIRRLERLGGCFAEHAIVVYENDSRDATPRLLADWAGANRRVHVTSERRSDPVNPTTRCPARAARMARYRRECQAAVLARHAGYDAVIVVDLDLLGGWSLDGVAHTFGQEGWDFVGANGLIYRRRGLRFDDLRQYDTWALRLDAALTPLEPAWAGGMVYARGAPLVPVTSCFGGLGIYTMAAFRAGRYGTDDLEHATFHRALIARGFDRLFLNPSQLVIYGRRHRWGDAVVERGIAAWARLAGRAAPVPRFLSRPAAPAALRAA